MVGHQNLINPAIQAAIDERVAADPAVATREERQQFWTKIMNDTGEDMRDRLRASEILGKSQGDFVERREVKLMSWADLVSEVDNARATQGAEAKIVGKAGAG